MTTRSFYGECSASEEKPTRWLSRLGMARAWSTPKVRRSQLYVDDPSIVAGSTPDGCAREFDVISLFWLALGFTLAWSNGSHTVGVTNEEKSDTGAHELIGIQYALRGNLAVMSLPAPFVTSACEALRPFTRRRCFESLKLARCAVGKAARVAKLYQKRRFFLLEPCGQPCQEVFTRQRKRNLKLWWAW